MSLGKFDYSVESVQLTSSTGQKLEIKDLVISIDIYESLLSPYIKVELGITDASNLLETVPILGQEKVDLVLLEGKTKIKKTFYVGSVANYIRANNQASMYTLKLITPEQLMNSLRLVSHAYTGKISDAVQGVMKDYLNKNVDVTEDTVGNYKLVIPNWNPYQAIDWLTRKAMDKNQTPFAFYETFTGGHRLQSYTTLFNQKTYNKFVHKGGTSASTDAAQLAASYNVAIEYDIRDYSNTYKNTLRGAFGSAMHTVDISTRSYKLLKYDYLKDFDKKAHLDKVPFINKEFKVENKPLNEYDSVHYVANKNSKAWGTASYNNYNNEAEFTKLEADAYVYQLGLTTLNMVVRGRTDLYPGKIIEFEVDRDRPSIYGVAKDSNEYISGRYLVMHTHHKMVDGKYTIIMDVVRDSLGKKVKQRGGK